MHWFERYWDNLKNIVLLLTILAAACAALLGALLALYFLSQGHPWLVIGIASFVIFCATFAGIVTYRDYREEQRLGVLDRESRTGL